MKSKSVLAAALLAAGCASYTIPLPENFQPAATLPVSGASGFNQRSMTVGDYQVSIDRGSTRERGGGIEAINTARKQQNYSFVLRRAGATAFSGGCTLSARATNIGGPGGVQITAKESAELDCELLPQGQGRESW